MPIMLTDTQSILLAAAAQRADLSLLPLPASIAAPSGGVTKSLASLVKRGLAEERETSDRTATHRVDGDLRFGLYATPAGLQAIGVEPIGTEPEVCTPAPEGSPTTQHRAVRRGSPSPASASSPADATERPSPRPGSKAERVLALLERADGATLAELIAETGWLPHTTRAALTGLRKKGHGIERFTREGATCYRVSAER